MGIEMGKGRCAGWDGDSMQLWRINLYNDDDVVVGLVLSGGAEFSLEERRTSRGERRRALTLENAQDPHVVH